MTAEDIIHIVEKWKEAVVGLDRMVYEDAKRNFSGFHDRFWCGWFTS